MPERFELGTLAYELLAGVTAAVDFLDSFGGMPAIAAHEDGLLQRLLTGIAELPAVRVFGSPARRTPTILVHVAGSSDAQVREHLAALGVLAPNGTFYATEAARHAGLGTAGGVRIGLAPYTSAGDIDRLLEGLASVRLRVSDAAQG